MVSIIQDKDNEIIGVKTEYDIVKKQKSVLEEL
jgi:hypothetical protein